MLRFVYLDPLVAKLRANRLPATEISALVKNATGETKFAQEEALLTDLLVAMKLLSDSSGMDAPGLASVAQGYDAIRLTATGRDPVLLRVLSIGDFPSRRQDGVAPPPPPPPHEHGAPAPNLLADLGYAIAVLGKLSASAFEPVAPSAIAAGSDRGPAAREGRVAFSLRENPTGAALAQGSSAWMLSAAAVSGLPAPVRDTLSELDLDLQTQPLPAVLNVLQAKRAEQETALAKTVLPQWAPISQFGNAFDTVSSGDYVGEPSAPLPTGHGNIQPVGVGDLLMVKEHVLRYEGGDLAHTENVLKSEHFSRDTRRLERTETTVMREVETTKEETRDTQTTDRFSLKHETSDTIKTDSSIKAGLSVDEKYGPTVEVKHSLDFATSVSAESAAKQASEFSKDVVERSVSKLVERILERRTVTTITEFEEKYSHSFDNTNGTGHISGYYQWIDKILQAQVYNYGKRLLFDVTVPEPGTNFILAQTLAKDVAQPLQQPPAFTATASDITEGNYRLWAKMYDTTGLEPPPPLFKTIVQVYDGTFPQDNHESSKSWLLKIEEGYRAKYASFVKDARQSGTDGLFWRVLVGSTWYDALTGDQYRDMAGEIDAMGVAYDARQISVMSMSIEIFCERTPSAFEAWQLKTHAAITQAYQAKVQAYEQALAQARAAAQAVIAGRNPEFNKRLVALELRRQCLTLLTGQQFDGFGALELSAEGYAQPNLARTEAQMPYVRFFEQAFEWEHLVYFFYPYFWGWKKGWKNRMLLDDADPAFGDFLRAGAARVVFPVRPGFEEAVEHYLESKGDIWTGGPLPPIGDKTYVPIIKEIQEATGAPGSEQPVGDPWEVHLPTTLVRLRPHDDLPAWHKVGEKWEPAN